MGPSIPLTTISGPSSGPSDSPALAEASPQTLQITASTSQPVLPQSPSSACVAPITQNEAHQRRAESSTMGASSPANSEDPSLLVTPPQKISSIKRADKQPWRYRGYRTFCRWLASDDDFFVLRRFGSSSARVALFLQDQVVETEHALMNEDAEAEAVEEGVDNGTFRRDLRPERLRILGDLLSQLERYHQFVLNHMELKSHPRASKFQINNVRQWLINANHPIAQEEVAFVGEEGEDDLIPVTSKPKTPLRRFIDKFNLLRLAACFRERKKNERLFTQDDFEMQTTVYSKDSILDGVVTFITVMLGLAMLIGPLWLLQRLSNNQSTLHARLGVITGFLALFTPLPSLFTVAKPFEVLAATAAYGAVLMVFMQFGTYATTSNSA
ncbi:hypothetical protein ABVK25_008907 [Lepraria finkii]|uniref:DUF6594 domain-containing protein n=1 Tax=Lepraria finkii TaxID=1340010 RepID=A0ABR4AYW6_9LECA